MKIPDPRLLLAVCTLAGAACSPDKNTETAAPEAADTATYENPILFADYSDPDVVQHGDTYWMTSSSFSHVPALPILRSKDLINWELVNHALPRLVPEEHFSTPRHGEGVWAPSFRYHDGKFWIFYGDPDFGIYVLTAENPAGEWSAPHLLKAGQGLIDPCPIWDTDGRAYIVYAWARSRASFNNILTVEEMTPDGTQLLGEPKTVIDGNLLEGWRTLEGPKFYKREGWYWIFAPAGGVAEGYQAVFRSRSVWGPYTARIVLSQGSTAVNGPHQGAWVQTPNGDDWFFHFQEYLPFGRIVHLQPMEWRDDGWPVMGADPDGTGEGEPVARHSRPALPPQPRVAPPDSDDFQAPELGLQWQWQANPSATWYDLDGAGSLRLHCIPRNPAHRDSLWLTPNLLLQKLLGPSAEASVSLNFSPEAIGDQAGLIVFGFDYRWLGLRQTAEGLRLVLSSCHAAHEGGTEDDNWSRLLPPALAAKPIELRVTIVDEGRSQFAYRLAGASEFIEVGEPFQATRSRWVGAKVGVFATGETAAPSGSAQFRNFQMKSPVQ